VAAPWTCAPAVAGTLGQPIRSIRELDLKMRSNIVRRDNAFNNYAHKALKCQLGGNATASFKIQLSQNVALLKVLLTSASQTKCQELRWAISVAEKS
jgi:hypothetical protein